MGRGVKMQPIHKPMFNSDMSEEELKQCIEFWISFKYHQDITITHLSHNVGERTGMWGTTEISIPYQEGVTIICRNKEEIV